MNTTSNKLLRLMTAVRGMAMVAMCLLVVSFVACSDKGGVEDNEEPNTPVTPVNPANPEDYQTVPTSGATLDKGDITVTFPENTFSETTDIAITEVKTGDVAGEDEVSKFYQLTVPPQIDKPLTMSIECKEEEPGMNVIAHVPCYHLSEDIEDYQDIILESEYANGKYTFTLPATNNNDAEEGEQLSISFGVAKMDYLGASGTASVKATRASDVFEDKFTEGNVSWHFNFGWRQKAALADRLDANWEEINECIRDAIKKLHSLGLKVTDRDVTFSFKNIKEYGTFCQSRFCNEWSSIQVGTTVLDDFANSKESFRSTIIHELMHMYQADYDPRCAYRKADRLGALSEATVGKISDGLSIHDGSERLMLYESGAVWAEQFMIGKFNYSYAQNYVGNFIRGFYDIGSIYTSGTTHKAYESHGYGMSILMEYITKKLTRYNLDDKSIVKLYEIWHNTNGWSRDCIKQLTSAAGHDVFSNYDDFILSVLKGEVSNGINISSLSGAGSGGKITETTTKQETTGKSFVHGGQVDCFNFVVSDDMPLDNKQLVISQLEEGCRTYVIIPETNENGEKIFVEYGFRATKDQPIVIPCKDLFSKFHLSGKKSTQCPIFTVTTNRDNKKTLPYKVQVELKDDPTPVPVTLTRASLEINFLCDVITGGSFPSQSQRKDPVTAGGTSEGATLTSSYVDGTTLHVEYYKEENHGQSKETLTFDVVNFPDIANAQIKNVVLRRHSEKDPALDEEYNDYPGYSEYVYDLEAKFEPLTYNKASSSDKHAAFSGYEQKGLQITSFSSSVSYTYYGSKGGETRTWKANANNNAWIELEWE